MVGESASGWPSCSPWFVEMDPAKLPARYAWKYPPSGIIYEIRFHGEEYLRSGHESPSMRVEGLEGTVPHRPQREGKPGNSPVGNFGCCILLLSQRRGLLTLHEISPDQTDLVCSNDYILTQTRTLISDSPGDQSGFRELKILYAVTSLY